MNYDIVLRVVDQTSKGLKNTEKSISKVSKSARLAKGALVGVGAAIGGIVAAGATIKKTIDSFDALAKRARNVGSATEESFESFQLIDQLLSEAGLSAGETDRALNNLNLRLADAQKGGKAYADAYSALGDSILDAEGQLKSAPKLFEAVGEAVQSGKLDLEDAADILGERVGPKIVGALKSMMEQGMSLEDALASVKENSNIVGLDAATNAEAFNDTMSRVGNTLMQVLTDAITPMLPVLNELANDLLAVMPTIIENVKIAFEKLQPFMTGLGTIVTEVIIPALKLMWEGWMALLDILGPVYEKALPALSEGIQFVGEVISAIVETIVGFIEKIRDIGSAVTDTVSSMREAGGDIVDGVTEGISEGAEKAVDAVKGMGSDIANGFKDFLGINSPSKVFKGFGLNITDGLTDGIIEGSNNVVPQMDKLAQDVEKQGSKIGDNLGKTISSGLEDGKLELSDFKSFFMETIASLATQAISANMGGAMGGGAGTLGGVIASGIGSLFFADGGRIGAGQAGIVGEAGPELVKGPATVYSNSKTQGMMGGDSGGGDNITYAPVFQTTINPGENTSPDDARKFAEQFNSTIEAKVTDTIIKMQDKRNAFQKARPY